MGFFDSIADRLGGKKDITGQHRVTSLIILQTNLPHHCLA